MSKESRIADLEERLIDFAARITKRTTRLHQSKFLARYSIPFLTRLNY